MHEDILSLAARSNGVTLDELFVLFGCKAFDIVDELAEDLNVFLDDREGIVYSAGSMPSPGLKAAVDSYIRGNE